MAHLTLQLGGPIVVPFKIPFRNRRRRGLPGWKGRSRLEASAIDGGLPVLGIPLQRRHALHGASYLTLSMATSSIVMRPDMRVPIIAALFAATILTGCASITPVPTTVVTAGIPAPEEALRQSMQHVDAEMAQLGTFRPEPAQTAVTAAPVMPEDLQRVVSFTWSGSLDKGVAKLAQSIGYTFYTTAVPNTPPLSVVVQVSSAPAFEVFKALGDQAGTLATVEVDPLHHQIQVIHHA